MSVKDGDMWGALTITDLSDDGIDAFCKASGRVDAGEDGRDFFETDRCDGAITFMGNLDVLYDALCVMADEADNPEWAEVCHEASKKYHDEFTDTFNGPA